MTDNYNINQSIQITQGFETAAPPGHALRQEQARPPAPGDGGGAGAHPDGARPLRGVEARQPHRGPHPRRIGKRVDGGEVSFSLIRCCRFHFVLQYQLRLCFFSRKDSPHINRIVHPYDWTFTPTDYRGTLTPEAAWKIEPSNKGDNLVYV